MHWRYALAACAAACLNPAPAWAALEICNDTSAALSVAVGYKSGGDWRSEGWWQLEPGGCVTPVEGVLEHRFYYFRAEAEGWNFQDDAIAFCTKPGQFVITGDMQCGSRGYSQAYFAKIDTGTSGLRHTLMLSSRVSPADVQTQNARPGAYGKPYTGQVVFQECRRSSGGSGLICCFVDKGTRIQVSEDGRTPRAVFDYLKGLPPGTPVTVDGDLDEVFGAAATMVLRDVRLRPATPFDEILKQLQGRWVSAQDPADRFLVLGAERHNTYAGVEMSKDYITVQSNCGGRDNDGPYLYAWDSEGGTGLCYVIEQITGETLTLTYLPRGSRMEYRRLE